MENLNEIMRTNLRKNRANSLMTMTAIAKTLGIDRKTLMKYEKNPVNCPIVKLKKLCDVYGCTVKSLME